MLSFPIGGGHRFTAEAICAPAAFRETTLASRPLAVLISAPAEAGEIRHGTLSPTPWVLVPALSPKQRDELSLVSALAEDTGLSFQEPLV